MRSIAISSGHGKLVSGASGIIDEVTEARRVAERVVKELRGMDCDVNGPFNDNTSTSQDENLNAIVDWHNGQLRDLDVSVHFNANEPTTNPMGTECLYVTQELLAEQVATAISLSGELKNRGPKLRSDLYFLNNTDEPAILIEVCFVDSEADVDTYERNFDAICDAIARVISGEVEV